MNRKSGLAAAAIMVMTGSHALAQTTAPAEKRISPTQVAIEDQNAKHGAIGRPPLEGANSFTMDQAKTRIEGAGYAEVLDLKKDEHGVWRGSAVKGGRNVSVALDYRGNVVQAQ